MKSIRIFLSVVILSTITLMAFLSALNGYRDSMIKAESLFDSELKDKAHLLSMSFSARNFSNDFSNDLTDKDTIVQPEKTTFQKKLINTSNVNELAKSGDFFAFQIWHNDTLLLHSGNSPKEAIAQFKSGFHNRNFLSHRWRTFSYHNNDDLWIITAERIDIRYVLAENIVLETILPVVIMLPVLGFIIWMIISYGLKPLRRLSIELENKRADDLTPLSIENQPVELIQVVNSTNDLFKRLKAAFFREKRFASDAAHELRTPISAIKIHLHNLSHLIIADESQTTQQSFLKLKSSVDRMGHLVEQILNLNRTSTEQYVTRFTVFDLYNLAQEIIIKEYEHFDKKEQKIELDGEHCYIKGDKFSLELLLQNLLTNACKYTPQGGTVLIHIKKHENKVFLQVEDSGPGVEVKQYGRLFDRFYRLDGDYNASETIGCGLGLAIVKQIVELHQAEISLDQSSFPSGLLVNVMFDEEHLL